MLETDRRRLLLESLRPPPGMRLDRAVGTTYSLDLISLLTAPLAFTFFDREDEEGRPLADPVALLESLRRYAGRVRIYCQAGRIRLPRPNQKLLAFLEEMVVEARAPRDDGVFHPKVWLLRYVDDGGEVHFRLLCTTRNLTFDRCWDTSLVLDGAPSDERRPENEGLGVFLRGLARCAVRPLHEDERLALHTLAAEVEHVRFDPPEGFEELAFWPLGLTDYLPWPFKTRGERRRMLVVSPFLSPDILRRFGDEQKLEILVSTTEELDRLGKAHDDSTECLVLAPDAELESRDPGDDDDPETDPRPDLLSGLHAKLYVIEDGWRARLWTGSANATHAAFRRNVELLVELRGLKSKCGIDAILGSDQPGAVGLRELLRSYEPKPPERPALDLLIRQLTRELERLGQRLAEAGLLVRVERHTGDELFDWSLDTRPLLEIALPPGVSLTAWPATLPPEAAAVVEPPAEIRTSLSFEGLTAFVAIHAELEREGTSVESSFVLRCPLEGAPSDRAGRLARSVLVNPDQVLRLLMLLLAEDALDLFVFRGRNGDGRWEPQALGLSEPTLLEALLRTLEQSPRRLDDIARLLGDLRATPEGAALLPADFDAIWEPIWSVRQEMER